MIYRAHESGENMVSKSQILKTIEKNQDQIKALGVKRLAIFGSFARNSPKKTSDIDVLVEFYRGEKTFDHFLDLKDLLKKLLRRKIDLVTKNALKAGMKPRILEEAHYARL